MSLFAFFFRLFRPKSIKITVPATVKTYEDIVAPVSKVMTQLAEFNESHLAAAVQAEAAAAQLTSHGIEMRQKAGAAARSIETMQEFFAKA